jgi:hypothetical protein
MKRTLKRLALITVIVAGMGLGPKAFAEELWTDPALSPVPQQFVIAPVVVAPVPTVFQCPDGTQVIAPANAVFPCGSGIGFVVIGVVGHGHHHHHFNHGVRHEVRHDGDRHRR